MSDLATISELSVRATPGFPHEEFYFTAAFSLGGAALLQEFHVNACPRRPPAAARDETKHAQMCSVCRPESVHTTPWVAAWHNALWAANALRSHQVRIRRLEQHAPTWSTETDREYVIDGHVPTVIAVGLGLNGLSGKATLHGYIHALLEHTSAVVDTREHDSEVAALLRVRDMLKVAFDELVTRFRAVRDLWPAEVLWKQEQGNRPLTTGIAVARRLQLWALNVDHDKKPATVAPGLAAAMSDVIATVATGDGSAATDLVAIRIPAGSLEAVQGSMLWATTEPAGVSELVAQMAMRVISEHAAAAPANRRVEQLDDAIAAAKMALCVAV